MRYLLLHGTKPYESLAPAQNALSFELEMLANYLQVTAKASVQIASPHNVHHIDLAEVDSIILNCFGDGESPALQWFATALRKFASTANKKVYWLMTDPAFFAVPESFMPREFWQKRLRGLFIGSELERYKPTAKQDYWLLSAKQTMCYNQLLGFMFKTVHDELSSHKPAKSFDFVYAGRAREPGRMAVVERMLIQPEFCTLFVGYKTPVMPIRQAFRLQKQAVATLVLGDADYAQLLPRPHRLLQAWALDLAGFVYEPFDPARECLRAMPEHLQGLLYVSEPWQMAEAVLAFANEPKLLQEVLAWQRQLLSANGK